MAWISNHLRGSYGGFDYTPASQHQMPVNQPTLKLDMHEQLLPAIHVDVISYPCLNRVVGLE